MELFAKITTFLAVNYFRKSSILDVYFRKSSILDVWLASEWATAIFLESSFWFQSSKLCFLPIVISLNQATEKLYPKILCIMSASEIFRRTKPNPNPFDTPAFGSSGDQIKPAKCNFLNPFIAGIPEILNKDKKKKRWGKNLNTHKFALLRFP